MHSRPLRRRHPVIPASIALVLALAIAAQVTGLVSADASGAPIAPVAAPTPALGSLPNAPRETDGGLPAEPAAAAGASLGGARSSSAANVRVAAPKARPAPKPAPKPAPRVTPRPAAAYHGRNRVWIPALGINARIQAFPCSRSRPPDAGVYRWGCAGANNLYLMAHAWSTFKPLHDAYVAGRLHAGMRVISADASGHVRTFSVAWWRVVRPTAAVSWAWASQSRPSMTLQTCLGAHSEFRLIVRLHEVG